MIWDSRRVNYLTFVIIFILPRSGMWNGPVVYFALVYNARCNVIIDLIFAWHTAKNHSIQLDS